MKMLSKLIGNIIFNENSFEGGNNSSIKFPNLYQKQLQQPYEEFEFLKKMIFDPDFLSQHARNVIKFEKQKQRLRKRYPNLCNKNAKNTKINDRSGSYNRDSDFFENGKSPCFTNDNNNNKTKYKVNANYNLESYSNDNSTNKKINNSNLSKNKFYSPMFYKFPNNVNFKTIINNEKEKNTKTSTIFFDKKCNIKHQYKTPFNEIPESFPGITLLKFGDKKNKTKLKKIELYNKKNQKNKVKDDNTNITYKQQVMNKIKKTIKDNILRNARRVAFPIH